MDTLTTLLPIYPALGDLNSILDFANDWLCDLANDWLCDVLSQLLHN